MIITLVFIGIIGWHLSRAKVEVGFVVLMVVCLSMAQKGMLGQAVGAQLLQEYERGSLEMILSTSLTVKDVIDGQFAAASRQFRIPFAISLLLLWAGAGLVYVHFGQSAWLGSAALACYSAIFALEFRALRWVGIWSLVSADDPRKARGSAGFRLSMLPVLVAVTFYLFVQMLNWFFDTRLTFTPSVAIGLFLALAFCNALFWMHRAKRRLPHELRRFAHRRYMPQEQLTLLGRMGRFTGRFVQLNLSISQK